VLQRAKTAPAKGYRFQGFAPHEQDYEPSASDAPLIRAAFGSAAVLCSLVKAISIVAVTVVVVAVRVVVVPVIVVVVPVIVAVACSNE
jgi:hypothetical protein